MVMLENGANHMSGKNEFELQKQIIQFLRLNHFFCFAIPNGGSRNKIEAFHLKQSGVLAGASDIVILLKGGRCVFVELKDGKTGRQSDTQKVFQKNVESLGFQYLLWRSFDDCVSFVKNNY